MPILNWTMLWGAIKPKWPLAESWWKKCCSLRHWHSPNRAHMLGFGAHKERRFTYFSVLLKVKRGYCFGYSVEIIQGNFLDKIIFATFVQVRDAEMKELCSLAKEGSKLCERGLSPPSTSWLVSIAWAKDHNEQNEAGSETIPWAQTDPHLNSR